MHSESPIVEGVHTRRGAGDLDYVHVRAAAGSAVLCLQGAQLLEYRSASSPEPLLWVSESAIHRRGHALRGGIPICWPWFGPHPEQTGAPAHGYARISPWILQEARRLGDAIALTLRLVAPQDAGEAERHAELELGVEVGDSLRLRLHTRNRGPHPLRMTQALHAYLRVGDVRRLRLTGLDGATCVDKLDAMRNSVQRGALAFDGPIDRMFVGTESACVVDDPALRRRIRVSKEGSRSTVVWNPWREGAAALSDMREASWDRMLCVEAGNVERDGLTLPPGAEHVLGAHYQVLEFPGA